MCFMIFLMPLYFFPSHVNDVVFFFLADDLQRHNLEVQKEAKDLREGGLLAALYTSAQ